MKRLKSFLKILWAYIWPTAEIGKVNYMKTSEEYYNLPEQPKQIYVDGKPVKGLIPPRSILRQCRDIPENELLRKPPATYDECYKPEKPIRGNIVWDKEGVRFVPDKEGKYTKHQIADDVHYVKYIPEFDDSYVIGCDPTNPESKSEGTFHFVNLHGEPITNPSPFLKEQLRKAKERQLAYLKSLYLELIELSGEVSEQSVILPMMDEVCENTMILEDIIKKINSPETREAIDNTLMDLFDYGECRMPDINFSIKRRGAV